MNPIKVIANLNPHIGSYAERTGDGVEAESAGIIAAHALGGLAKGPELLVRYVWSNDRSVFDSLKNMALIHASDIMYSEQWTGSRKLMLTDMVVLALFELLGLNKCTTCDGRELESLTYVKESGGFVVCPKCKGTGSIAITETMRRDYLRLTMHQWAVWGNRYSKIYNLLADWQNIALRHVVRKMADS